MSRINRLNFIGPPIDKIRSAAFRIPTATPESDGTLEWASTTLVLVEAEADGKTGIGFSYADTATARLINDKLADIVVGCDAQDAHVEVTLFFSDRDPVGPYRFTVNALRTKHVRFNEFTDPEPVPHNTDYASVIESDVPIVVQHTRLDSRQTALALMTTVAYPA